MHFVGAEGWCCVVRDGRVSERVMMMYFYHLPSSLRSRYMGILAMLVMNVETV